jgi:hypothetical protein
MGTLTSLVQDRAIVPDERAFLEEPFQDFQRRSRAIFVDVAGIRVGSVPQRLYGGGDIAPFDSSEQRAIETGLPTRPAQSDSHTAGEDAISPESMSLEAGFHIALRLSLPSPHSSRAHRNRDAALTEVPECHPEDVNPVVKGLLRATIVPDGQVLSHLGRIPKYRFSTPAMAHAGHGAEVLYFNTAAGSY